MNPKFKETKMNYRLPETGFLRLWQIIGDPKRDIPQIIPVCAAAWWKGVKSGLHPAPVKLSKMMYCNGEWRTFASWRRAWAANYQRERYFPRQRFHVLRLDNALPQASEVQLATAKNDNGNRCKPRGGHKQFFLSKKRSHVCVALSQ
jgi:hypothetical protein